MGSRTCGGGQLLLSIGCGKTPLRVRGVGVLGGGGQGESIFGHGKSTGFGFQM